MDDLKKTPAGLGITKHPTREESQGTQGAGRDGGRSLRAHNWSAQIGLVLGAADVKPKPDGDGEGASSKEDGDPFHGLEPLMRVELEEPVERHQCVLDQPGSSEGDAVHGSVQVLGVDRAQHVPHAARAAVQRPGDEVHDEHSDLRALNGGPVQRLTMAALTPTICKGQDHGTGSGVDSGRHESLPCGLERRRIPKSGLRAPIRARATRRATVAGLANASREMGSAHARLGSPEAIQWTPSARQRRYSRRKTGVDSQRNPQFSNHLAIGRSGARNIIEHRHGPMNPAGTCMRSEQCGKCASTGNLSSVCGLTNIGDQRISGLHSGKWRVPAVVARWKSYQPTHERGTHKNESLHDFQRQSHGCFEHPRHNPTHVHMRLTIRGPAGLAGGAHAKRASERKWRHLSDLFEAGCASTCSPLGRGNAADVCSAELIEPLTTSMSAVISTPPQGLTLTATTPRAIAPCSECNWRNALVIDSARTSGLMCPCAPERTDTKIASLMASTSIDVNRLGNVSISGLLLGGGKAGGALDLIDQGGQLQRIVHTRRDVSGLPSREPRLRNVRAPGDLGLAQPDGPKLFDQVGGVAHDRESIRSRITRLVPSDLIKDA